MRVPMWVMTQPHPGSAECFLAENKEKTIKYMVKDLMEFISFAEKTLSRKLDWDNLDQRVDTLIKTLRVRDAVERLRMAVPSLWVSQDFWTILLVHYYFADEEEGLEFYKEVYDEVKYRVDNKIGALADEKYRMMFTELPPWHNIKFFDQLGERYSIAFVKESWTYPVLTHQKPFYTLATKDFGISFMR